MASSSSSSTSGSGEQMPAPRSPAVKRSGGDFADEDSQATHYRQLDEFGFHVDETKIEHGGYPDLGEELPGPGQVAGYSGV